MYEISPKIGFKVVKLAFGHFTSKTQTSSRFPKEDFFTISILEKKGGKYQSE